MANKKVSDEEFVKVWIDVANGGGILEDVGGLTGTTRQAAQQRSAKMITQGLQLPPLRPKNYDALNEYIKNNYNQ